MTPTVAAHESGMMLRYDAPWECPNREQFWRQFWARSTRLAGTKPGEVGITVDARISGVDSRYVGHLRLVDSAGAEVEREVTGPNCVDVSAALALITAVTLDAFPTLKQGVLPVPARQNKMPRRVAVGAVAGIHKAVASDVVPTSSYLASRHCEVTGDSCVRGIRG